MVDHTTERTPSPPAVRAVPAFESFYRTEYRPVVGLAYALSGSRIAAEDIAQDAFLAAHKQWDRVAAFDKPEAWVRRVVANKSVSAIRRAKNETRALTRVALQRQTPLPELDVHDQEFWDAVRKLPKRQAQALALFYLEDRSVAEVAEILDCAEATAKVHLHKGRKNLAQRLGLKEEAR